MQVVDFSGLMQICPQVALARSLSGKNWQDRDKADKVSISFSGDS